MPPLGKESRNEVARSVRDGLPEWKLKIVEKRALRDSQEHMENIRIQNGLKPILAGYIVPKNILGSYSDVFCKDQKSKTQKDVSAEEEKIYQEIFKRQCMLGYPFQEN